MPSYSQTQWQILCYTLSEHLSNRPKLQRWISNELGKKFAFLEDFEADMEGSSIDEATCSPLPPNW